MNGTLGLLGRRIKRLRERFNVTQEQLAEGAEISPKGLGDLERGKGNPTLSSLEGLANALGITLSELLDFENEELSGEEMVRELHSMIDNASNEKRRVFYRLLKALTT